MWLKGLRFLRFATVERFKCFVSSIVYSGLMPQVQKIRKFFKMLISRSEEAKKHPEILVKVS